MKNELTRITEMTINELLQNDVIMPSVYFKSFNANAKKFEINIKDESFDDKINKLLVDEFNVISDYMNTTISNINSLTEVTKNVERAMEENDKIGLQKAQKDLASLQNNIEDINNLIFQDELTKTYNKKWIYKKFLNTNNSFPEKGVLILLDIVGFERTITDYGYLISDNILIFVASFLNEHLKREELKYSLVRYLSNNFMIFIKNYDFNEITYILSNIQVELFNTTLKSKSGKIFKTGFNFNMQEYIKNDKFQDKLELALSGLSSAKKVKR